MDEWADGWVDERLSLDHLSQRILHLTRPVSRQGASCCCFGHSSAYIAGEAAKRLQAVPGCAAAGDCGLTWKYPPRGKKAGPWQ